jgi:glutathione S-transferase
MITVHHLNNSRSQRVLWLLEELALPYEIVRYQRLPSILAPPELKKIHPLGKSPVITDGGTTIAESGAIVEYIMETYANGRLMPARGTPDWRRYVYWMHYAEGSAMPLLYQKFLFNFVPRRAPWYARPILKPIFGRMQQTMVDPQLTQHVAFWESELMKSEWFAGDFLTAADIQMLYPLEAGAARVGFEAYPRADAWLARVRARPAYQKAVEKGGPFIVAK